MATTPATPADRTPRSARMRSAWCWLVVPALLLAPAAARPAEILRCRGPGGEVLFTNAACPAGFTLVERLPARVPPTSGSCVEADSLGPAEIEAALLDATAELQRERASGRDAAARASWERCLSLLAARKAALARVEAPSTPAGGKPPAEERVEAVCSVGSFETLAQPGGFDVLYTHLSRRACLSVPYYCLWGVFSSAGFYQQSESGVFRGRIDPGRTTAVATILPRGGPADREVVWSWCVKR